MYSGRRPETGLDGQPCLDQRTAKDLYGGIRFRLTEVRGDWKHHQTVWGLCNAAFTSNNICHCCLASRTDAAFSMLDFTREPGWAKTTRSHLEFLTHIMSSRGCPLIYVKGFHYSMIRWCSMHSVQLGAGLFLNGGCFHELMQIQWFPGNTQAERYRNAFRKFKAFINRHKIKCSQPTFKVWMYVATGEESCTFRSKVPWFYKHAWQVVSQIKLGFKPYTLINYSTVTY